MKINFNYLIETYEEFTGKASEILRSLALGGLAVIWIFSNFKEQHPSLPKELFLPLACLALALAIDLLQYLYAGLAFYILYKFKEGKYSKKPSEEFNQPKYINAPTWFFFFLKMASLVFAYVLLIIFLLSKVTFT